MKELFNTAKVAVTAKSDVEQIKSGKLDVAELAGMANKHMNASVYQGTLVGAWRGNPLDVGLFKPSKSQTAVIFALQELLTHGEEGRDAFLDFCEKGQDRGIMGLFVIEQGLVNSFSPGEKNIIPKGEETDFLGFAKKVYDACPDLHVGDDCQQMYLNIRQKVADTYMDRAGQEPGIQAL